MRPDLVGVEEVLGQSLPESGRRRSPAAGAARRAPARQGLPPPRDRRAGRPLQLRPGQQEAGDDRRGGGGSRTPWSSTSLAAEISATEEAARPSTGAAATPPGSADTAGSSGTSASPGPSASAASDSQGAGRRRRPRRRRERRRPAHSQWSPSGPAMPGSMSPADATTHQLGRPGGAALALLAPAPRPKWERSLCAVPPGPSRSGPSGS